MSKYDIYHRSFMNALPKALEEDNSLECSRKRIVNFKGRLVNSI